MLLMTISAVTMRARARRGGVEPGEAAMETGKGEGAGVGEGRGGGLRDLEEQGLLDGAVGGGWAGGGDGASEVGDGLAGAPEEGGAVGAEALELLADVAAVLSEVLGEGDD